MSSEPVIEVNDVAKRYTRIASPLRLLWHLLLGIRPAQQDDFVALQSVSFSVNKGQTFAIIGRNGAGKSTLLQIICGILAPSQGNVVVRGRVAALLELGAGFNPEFTGRENVYMNAAVHGLSREQVDQRMASILEFAEIGAFIDQPVKTYSSGMFVRLAFAVIAHLDADILVIDEALAVGDVYFTQKCMRFLREFAETRTLLFVSHDTHSVVALCERAIWLEQGQVKMAGAAKDVADAYLGSFYENNLVEPVSAEASPTTPELDSPARREFGLGQARITRCCLLSEEGREVVTIEAEQYVRLEVDCEALHDIDSPIVGFYLSDRLGQPLCGENTLGMLSEWHRIPAGRRCRVRFRFRLPLFATGHYTVSVALAAGSQKDHVQQHWIHDVLAFKAVADPHMTGLITLQDVSCQSEPLD